MKKSILFIAIATVLNSAQGQTCCKKMPDQEFAQLAMNESFAAAHLDPLPFNESKPEGKVITFKTSDTIPGNAYIKMADFKTNNWIFVYHEWWGLNEYIKKEADRLQSTIKNCNVIAIDLYDGKVAKDAKIAQGYSSNLNVIRVRNIIEGAVAYVGDEVKIVSLGWCMGGGWSLQSAWLEGKNAVGCVMYYGMPENDIEKLKKFPCDLLGIFGTKDQFINPKMIERFQSNLNSAGVKNTIKFFDADHAFANPSNPKHNVEATNASNDLVLTYIKEKFNN